MNTKAQHFSRWNGQKFGPIALQMSQNIAKSMVYMINYSCSDFQQVGCLYKSTSGIQWTPEHLWTSNKPQQTPMHPYIHRQRQTRTHAYTHMHTRTHAHMYARTHAHTRTCKHTHAHANTRTHKHTHALTSTHTRTHMHTCTHTHTVTDKQFQ